MSDERLGSRIGVKGGPRKSTLLSKKKNYFLLCIFVYHTRRDPKNAFLSNKIEIRNTFLKYSSLLQSVYRPSAYPNAPATFLKRRWPKSSTPKLSFEMIDRIIVFMLFRRRVKP